MKTFKRVLIVLFVIVSNVALIYGTLYVTKLAFNYFGTKGNDLVMNNGKDDEIITPDVVSNLATFSCKTTTYDLQFTPSSTPTKESTPMSLFTKSDSTKKVYDFDIQSESYLTGKVSGKINEVVVTNAPYYVAAYKSYAEGAAQGWYISSVLRYFKLPETGTIYVISDNFNLKDLETNLGHKGRFETNVVNLAPLYASEFAKNCYDDSLFDKSTGDNGSGTLVFMDYVLKSKKNNDFKLSYSLKREFLKDKSGYVDVDSYENFKIYRNNKGNFILIDSEGFVKNIELTLPFSENESNQLDITWSDTTKNTYQYTSSIGTCSANLLDIPYTYTYVDYDKTKLVAVGSLKNGDIVYESSDVNDVWLKKVYKEDYAILPEGLWKYNTITSDDSGPMTYAQYLKFHPVIYWETPYGGFARMTSLEFLMEGGCAKPAIYLYPDQVTDISVKVIPNGKLTYSLPKYNDGWKVNATPQGLLTVENKTYDYLWWDSQAKDVSIPEKGFVIKKDDISSFLDSKLTLMNLNEREKAQFKEYWVNRIEQLNEEYVFITFLFNDEVNQIAKLDVSPTPLNVFRMFMFYTPLSENVEVEQLTIPAARRTGYTLIEWGGAKN